MTKEENKQFNQIVANFVAESNGAVLVDAIKLGKELDSKQDEDGLDTFGNAVAFTIYHMFKLLINGEEQSD
jgi:hypothetical protein